MGGSQMFLILGALVLLSILILNVNRTWSGAEEIKTSAEFLLTATNVGQGLIDEISIKAFDQVISIDPNVTDVASLTPPNSLGPDAGETNRNLYNDVDDYHNQTFTVSTPRLGDFNITISVFYVNQNTMAASNVRTWTKKIQATIVAPNLFDENMNPYTLKLFYYKSY